MTTAKKAAGALDPRVRDVIETIEVAGGASHARLPGRELTARTPRDMRAQLASAIYECFHAGFPVSPKAARTLRDAALEAAFTDAVPHRHTPLTVPVIHAGDSPEIVVEISGVRVEVPRTMVDPAAGPVREGRPVPLTWPAVNPAVSPGYFFVTGSRGAPRGRSLVRLYLHVGDPGLAPGLLRDTLVCLEAAGIPYRAKAGSVPHHYPRQDAMVVYLGPEADAAVGHLVGALGDHPALLQDTSVFARRQAPGMATASEPADTRPGMRGMSFGEHRANVVAGALIEDATGPDTGLKRHELVAQRFTEARVDPRSPADNLN
ncbi:T3SS effector HopA1 family protein [Streptomyces sp. NPDC050147]|uniref:T3SS effector HopA1 family protein n=1 Tax=Streptomyces sp. NPDC050147 TaxID=3155513 RepID=UPI00343E3E9B